jgi:sugar phosphate isomerase/epimerase
MAAREEPEMQRREVLKAIGATFLASAGSSLLGDERAKPAGWRTAFGLNGFASSARKYHQTFPIWEVLDFAAQMRFDGIELHATWPMGDYPKPSETKRIAALKRLYDAYGLQVFSIQTGAGGAFSPDASDRRRWLEEFRDQARLAQALGCDCIGLWPGGGLRGQTIDEAIQQLGGSFRQAAEIASDLSLIPAFEIEPVFVFNTEDHLQRILQAANHPALKTIYDPSHFDLMNGSTGRPHEMLQRIGVPNIGYVHFTDTDGTRRDQGTSKHLPCGDGHIDVQASLATLWRGGFRGWMNIDAWEIPDPYDACRKGKAAFDRFLTALQAVQV